MPDARQIKAIWILTIGLGLGFAVLIYRLVDLQVLRHETLALKSNSYTQRRIERRPRRGNLLDIKRNLLATSKWVHTVCADPSIIGTNCLLVAQRLAPVMHLEESVLIEKLQPRITIKDGKTNVDKYVVLKHKVDDDEWSAITNAMEHLVFCPNEKSLKEKVRRSFNQVRRESLTSEEDQLRVYPNGSLAAHVLGYVGIDEKRLGNDPQKENPIRGKDGLEFTLDTFLQGVRGWRQTEADRRNHELVAYREQDLAPRDGYTAVLTIDAGIQHIVESELAAAWAEHDPVSVACTVIRPSTGEILALANLPTFDPNNLAGTTIDSLRNRVISDISEPGSTFKIVVISAALDKNIFKLSDTVYCEMGNFSYAGFPLHDAHEKFGILTLENVIAKSSNIGAAKVALQLGAENLEYYIRRYGFGALTGISLPGEVRGIVHPVSRWSKISITRIPMGHEVATTPLQTCLAMSAIANKGVLMRPQLVNHFEDDEGRIVAKYTPQMVRRVVSESVAADMVTALKTVVSTNGTGTKAQLDYYTVAGKTGTAQVAANGHYVPHKFFASFIGFFPADHPELCISVVFDEPNWKKGYYGGAIAAPVFKRIAERTADYLAIPIEPMHNRPTLAITGLSSGD